MKIVSTTHATLNSLLYVKDPRSEDYPEIGGPKSTSIWVRPSCIAVSCLPDNDGDTAITIGPSAEMVPDTTLLFDGWIETPSNRIVVTTVLDEEVLGVGVPSERTRLRIWTDGYQDTKRVTIGVG
ncbi:hypothetical protein [Bauldia sp.]|uniref:hypothetical protein n=1 Tax=Bauldia sp. TaxID=2575872 RepID=UPI003BAD17B3